MKVVVFALIVLLAAAHQDFWWWGDHQTLVLGFLPIGLAYHAGISVAAAILWALAVTYCWPDNLPDASEDASAGDGA